MISEFRYLWKMSKGLQWVSWGLALTIAVGYLFYQQYGSHLWSK